MRQESAFIAKLKVGFAILSKGASTRALYLFYILSNRALLSNP